jgi:hypothetical protein
MSMFRAINKDILKKGGKNDPNTSQTPNPTRANTKTNALMTSLDFEGFVEFLL